MSGSSSQIEDINSSRVSAGGRTHVHTHTHECLCNTSQHTATHCTTLQHTATHCNTLQHTATHCNTRSTDLECLSKEQHAATHYNTLQHTATHAERHRVSFPSRPPHRACKLMPCPRTRLFDLISPQTLLSRLPLLPYRLLLL